MAVVARCPSCRKTFPWDPALPLPTRCPLPGCDYVAPEREDDGVIIISAPFIGSAKTKATDGCYRELERSSEIRAQLAADMAGVPVSEMSHLKVTNIRDTREGEVAAIPIVNEVTKQMDLIKQRGGQSGFTGMTTPIDTGTADGAITVNGQVIRGIQPRAGVKAMDSIQARFSGR